MTKNRAGDLLLVEKSSDFRSQIERGVKQSMDVSIIMAETMEEARGLVDKDPDRFFLGLFGLNLPDAPNGEIVDIVLEKNIPVVAFTDAYEAPLCERFLSKKVIDFVVTTGPSSLENIVTMAHRIHRNRGITALVVDNSGAARRDTRNLLELYRLNVREAATGIEALKIIEEDPSIRLIVTEHDMQEIDGLELTAQLRKTHDRGELAIIGVSASGDVPLSARFIKRGANDFLNRPFLPEELFCRVTQNLDIQENTRNLSDATAIDTLTGLSNRRRFFDAAEALLAAAKRSNSPPALAVLDIDNFKRINDTHGHEVGDEVLEVIGHRIKGAMLRDTDVTARMGGQGFAVFAYDMKTGTVATFFESVREAIESVLVETAQGPIQVTISIGVCTEPGETIDAMLKAAEKSLYKAKANGRNCVVLDS